MPPLRFHHWGELADHRRTAVDERAEVGLLSRDIVIQGAPTATRRNLGGHIMIMAGSIGRIEGTELRFMGQMGRLGRYPFHWHLTGHAPIDYLRFSSVWNSFHRGGGDPPAPTASRCAATSPPTSGRTPSSSARTATRPATSSRTTSALLTKRAAGRDVRPRADGSSGAGGAAAQDEWRPGTFWVNNPRNTVRRNRAAGGLDAIGFFYDRDHGRAGAGDLGPWTSPATSPHSVRVVVAAGEPTPSTRPVARPAGAHGRAPGRR